MSREIRFRVIDSAGNITLLVTSFVDQQDYQKVSDALLSHEEYGGEQVGFVIDDDTMSMAGLEFCGNASRSFALYKACRAGLSGGKKTVTVNVSGASHPLDVEVDTDEMYTKIKMPLPVSIEELRGCPALSGTSVSADGSPVVIMEGIIHVICRGIPATEENFDILKDHIKKLYNPPAMGVMFVEDTAPSSDDTGNPVDLKMIPVVHVFDVDTTYFEGSCGSGTTALCAVMSLNEGSGTHEYLIHQPAGSILASGTVKKCDKSVLDCAALTEITIEGPVSISDEKTVSI